VVGGPAGAVGVAGALYAALSGAPGAGATVLTGVAVAAALVSAPLAFRAPAAVRLAAAARVTGRVAQVTAHDAAEVETILGQLRRAGVRIEDLEIGRADLEDVFLEIMQKESA